MWKNLISLVSLALLMGLGLFLVPLAAAQTSLIPQGADWKYLDDGSDQGTAWAQPGFDDGLWDSGPAQLGYGDGDEAQVVEYGPDINLKYPTTYFRHSFQVGDASSVVSLKLDILRDDGAIVYLNGNEVYRSNMEDPVDYLTHASATVGGADEDAFHTAFVDSSALVTGTNVLAVEIHQTNWTSSDISFDLRLETASSVTRGPYLQKASPTSMTIKWRTATATDSVVLYGTDEQNLDFTASSAVSTTEHEVVITGLTADTQYFYSVGDSSETFESGSDLYFVTHPLPATARDTRIWVLGDSGTANANARAVRDAFLAFNGSPHADLVMMLGDNAYNDGTDSEYQAAVFDMYPSVLRNSVLWSTLGNHDGHTADSASQSGPYYDIFSFPTGGESGGWGSGTEAYYSFDYANIHFVCLDSYDTSRSKTGAMATWLKDDLGSTGQEWIIAFWHHPPYSFGSHNSDNSSETRMTEMRTNFNPILEDYGVDLVLGGHSHAYERSKLIDGHYGHSSTLDSSHVIDGGDGKPTGTGAYEKATLAHQGAVYAVAGSSGKVNSVGQHPVMYEALAELGSMVLDINGNQLDASFLNNAGAVMDTFRITHTFPANLPEAPSDLTATALSSTEIDLDWVDNAIDETGFVIERSLDQSIWAEIATLGINVNSYSDSGLQPGTPYYYRVLAFNADGNSPYSGVANAQTEGPTATDYLASGEIASRGSVSGNFSDTHADGDGVQSIIEESSGGNQRKRRSLLEHTWLINIPSGGNSTLVANAWSGGSTDGDLFQFDYSLDGGSSWSSAFTVSSTDSVNVEMALLPAGASGEVRVRVTDTNRQQGNATLDTVFVDELYILVENGGGAPPNTPTGLMVTGVAAGQIDLQWNDLADESGYQLERKLSSDTQWTVIATTSADVTSFADGGLIPSTAYQYRLLAFNGSGPSDYASLSATTTAGMALATTGYKVKGKITVDLTWSGMGPGVTDVEIFRNGQSIATVPAADGSYTDATGQKGGGTFTYKVCDQNNGAECSNESTVTF